MDGVQMFLGFITGLALFLYGMNVLGDGLEKVSGGKLEQILEKLTSNTFKGILLGAGVTAIIQSSSASTVMVVGFVNSGIMTLERGISIVIGANLGTCITSWILSLSGLEGDNFFIQMLKPANFSPILEPWDTIPDITKESIKSSFAWSNNPSEDNVFLDDIFCEYANFFAYFNCSSWL